MLQHELNKTDTRLTLFEIANELCESYFPTAVACMELEFLALPRPYDTGRLGILTSDSTSSLVALRIDNLKPNHAESNNKPYICEI